MKKEEEEYMLGKVVLTGLIMEMEFQWESHTLVRDW